MRDQFVAVFESMKSFWTEIWAAAPVLLAATVLLLAGWLVARLVRRGVLRVLRWLHVDEFAERAGIENFLLQGGVRYTTVSLVANLVYWLIMFTFVLAALESMGLQTASAVFNKIVWFMPNIIVAVIVLMFGAFIARIVRGVTFTYLSNVGISGADVIGHLAQWAILLFVVSLALEQMSVGGQLLVSAFQIGFGAFCLALAIAFGLGGKDWAAHVLSKLWKQ